MAGINMLWCFTRYSVANLVINEMSVVDEYDFESVVFPLIDADSGSRSGDSVLDLMQSTLVQDCVNSAGINRAIPQ